MEETGTQLVSLTLSVPAGAGEPLNRPRRGLGGAPQRGHTTGLRHVATLKRPHGAGREEAPLPMAAMRPRCAAPHGPHAGRG